MTTQIPCPVLGFPLGWDIFPFRWRTMAQIREKSQGEPEDVSSTGPFTKWFTWGHMAVTVGLATLLYNVWNDGRNHDLSDAATFTKLETRVTVLESDTKHFLDAERAQNEALTKQITVLTQRIDAQRDDIRALQMLIIRHMDRETSKR